MHTHYYRPTRRWFSLATCETCGGRIQAPNAITSENAGTLLGVRTLDVLPPEGYFDDETGMERCDHCDANEADRYDIS